jgi:acetylornithine deacetylase
MAFDLLDFHERAVRTPSHESVGEMRTLLIETLRANGVEPRIDDAGNTVAVREGDAEGPHLVLNTHIDTVAPHVPFEERDAVPGSDGEQAGDIVMGRGACDAKGPLAALIDAFLGATVTRGKLTLAVTPDEEVNSTGAAALTLDADAYVVGEPTGLDVCNAARGRFQGQIHLSGVAAHAAEPDSGESAIRAAAPVLAALETFDDQHGPGEHPSLGAPTLTATTIEGGEATNQVPASCAITVDRRSVPPETATGFRESLEAHLSEQVPASIDCRVELADRQTPFLEAFATEPEEGIVRALTDASGGAVRPFGAATEASYFAADTPTVVFGPGDLSDEFGAVAHAEREYVDRRDIERAAEAVETAVESVLG